MDADDEAKAGKGCLTWLGIFGLHLIAVIVLRDCEGRTKPKLDEDWRKILRPADKWRGSAMPRLTILTAISLAAAFHPVTAAAEGALALGLPADVAREGASVGWAVGQPTGRAASMALQQCRTNPEVPQAARDLCRVVQVFNAACVAIAVDPAESTPGFGWAIAGTKAEADAAAMRGCHDTAGAARRAFCKIGTSECDRR